MVKNLEVVVDGTAYQTQYREKGGITRIFNEILPRMCEMDASLRLTLFTSGRLREAPPSHPQIINCSIPQIERFLRPYWLWKHVTPQLKEVVRRTFIDGSKDRIWHSTYYTMPERWDGPQVVTVVDMIYELFPHLFDNKYAERFKEHKRRCIMAAEAVICISGTTKKDLQDLYGISDDNVWVVPLGCAHVFKRLEDWVDDNGQVASRPFLLYVGSRSRYKDFGTLLKSYSLWPQHKDIDLVVVGRNWSTPEIKYMTDLGVSSQIHLLQSVDDEALCILYNTARAFVHPSLYEGFGIPLLEAMACGCPIVASRIPATVEVAGNVPIYFEAGKVEELISALDRAMLEGQGAKRTIEGLRHVKQFSWNKTAEQTLEIYRRLLG